MTRYSLAKQVLIGKPLANERMEHQRLDKKTALAVLSSDAISSVAYATDQILFALGGAIGLAALNYVMPISAMIVGLLALVGISYRQTVLAYPLGGGSYTVAKENLGQRAGLVAAGALLIDYVLTVATSVSAGVAAITSAYPSLLTHTVALGVLAILFLMVMNLRGVRESGIAFSIPTYAFIAMMLGLIGFGVYRVLFGPAIIVASAPLVTHAASLGGSGGLSPTTTFALAFLLMRGFAEGCVAMTGTEAISNGVQVFRPPSSRNAAVTLGWMVAILATFFLGVSYLAKHFGVMPTAAETVLSQLGHHVFGAGAAYFLLQYTTFALLVLAANTAFADFPRLAGILANDRYMPRQLAARPPRLFQRHHRTRPGRDRALVVVPRQHERPHPAVCHRRLCLLHAVPGRDGGALGAQARARLAPARHAERCRRGRHGDRDNHPGRHKVHRGRLDCRRTDSIVHRRAAIDPHPLPPLRNRCRLSRPQPDSSP